MISTDLLQMLSINYESESFLVYQMLQKTTVLIKLSFKKLEQKNNNNIIIIIIITTLQYSKTNNNHDAVGM